MTRFRFKDKQVCINALTISKSTILEVLEILSPIYSQRFLRLTPFTIKEIKCSLSNANYEKSEKTIRGVLSVLEYFNFVKRIMDKGGNFVFPHQYLFLTNNFEEMSHKIMELKEKDIFVNSEKEETK